MKQIEKIEELKRVCHNNTIYYKENVKLSEYSYFKMGKIVKLLLEPKTREEIKIIVSKASELELPIKTIGETTNVLFLDDKNYSILLTTRNLKKISFIANDMIVSAEAGVLVHDLTRFFLLKSFKGFEGLEGIPGNVGGALVMNAGAYGFTISDMLHSVTVITTDGIEKRYLKEELEFGNRTSLFKHKNIGIAVSADFKMVQGNQDVIYNKMCLYHSKRHTYQDFMYPSLGSIFATLDLYMDIGKHYPLYKIGILVFRKMFYNKLIKKRPIDNKILNKFTWWYFKWNFKKQPHSHKTINCCINNNLTTNDVKEYIKVIKDLTRGEVNLENELLENFLLEE